MACKKCDHDPEQQDCWDENTHYTNMYRRDKQILPSIYPSCKRGNLGNCYLACTKPPKDWDWEPEVDRYNSTAPGWLGKQRPSMLKNHLLARSALGKTLQLDFKASRPKDFTYGTLSSGNEADPDSVRHALARWPRRPTPMPEVRPPDFLGMNRAAVSQGHTNHSEFRDFRNTHSIKRKEGMPKKDVLPNIAFGLPSGHHPSMSELLTNKAQNDWLRSVKMCKIISSNIDDKMVKKNLKATEETKACYLRRIANAPKIQDDGVPWHMPKFERKAKSAISTFRTEGSLQADRCKYNVRKLPKLRNPHRNESGRTRPPPPVDTRKL